jgi:hypothetical protein
MRNTITSAGAVGVLRVLLRDSGNSEFLFRVNLLMLLEVLWSLEDFLTHLLAAGT